MAILGLLVPLLSGCGEPKSELPDVLLISIDTLRADRLSCYGHDRPTSPNLDRIAARGLRFANAIAPSIHTAPSHMSMFTGLDPVTHGVRNYSPSLDFVNSLNREVSSLPEHLQAAGYRTACFTDHGNLMPQMGFGRGWDDSHVRLEPLAKKVSGALRWLGRAPADEPVFVFFHTYETHAPYIPPERVHGTFADTAYEGPLRSRYEALRAAPEPVRHAAARDFLKASDGFREEERQFLTDLYDECVLHADEQIGKLWRRWREIRGGRETLLVILSDHGESLGERGRYGHHAGTSRELVHVPLLMSGPGIPIGVREEPVAMAGLAATLLEALGLQDPGGQEPSFLRRTATGTDAEPRAVFTQLWGPHRSINYDAVLLGSTHLMRRVEGETTQLELGDWESGAALPLEEAAGLRALLDARLEGDISRVRLRPPARARSAQGAERRELEGLGYAGDD